MSELESKIIRLEEAVSKLGASQEAPRRCQDIVDLVADTFRKDICRLYILKEDNQLVAEARRDHAGHTPIQPVQVGEGIVGWVAGKKRPAIVPNLKADSRYIKDTEEARSGLTVPLVHGDELVGVLDVQSRQLNAFTQIDASLMQIFAAHAACAIATDLEIERCEDQISALTCDLDNYEIVHQINRIFVEQPDFLQSMQQTADCVARHVGCDYVSVLLLDSDLDELEVVATHNLDDVLGLRIPISKGVTGYCVRHREPVNMRNASTDPRYMKSTPGCRSELAVPIFHKERILGVIDMQSPVTNAFDETDVPLLELVAGIVSACISVWSRDDSIAKERAQRHRIEDEVKQLQDDLRAQLKTLDDRARRLDLLNRVTRSLTRTTSIDELLDELLCLCAEAFNVSHCALMLKDVDPQILVRRASINYDENSPLKLSVGEGITGHVAATGVPILVADVTKDPRYITGIRDCRAEMAAPLRVFDEVIGVLDAESHIEGAFNEEDLDLFTSFAAQAAVAILSADVITKFAQPKDG